MKRGDSGKSLIVGIDKEAGHSSHSALSHVKRELGEKRVGHCGTLDPFATGVLVVLVGPATGLSRYLESDSKSYIAEIAFGRSTTTDDIEGATVDTSSNLPSRFNEEDAKAVLEGFIGTISQRPPDYSALKLQGKRAYEQARKGVPLDIPEREVTVSRAELMSISEIDDEGRDVPVWQVTFDVSKGTYIRSLARDIGRAVGSVGYLRSLRRTLSGKVPVSACIPEGSSAESILASSLDPVMLLGGKLAFLDDEALARVSNGNPVPYESVSLYEHVGSVCLDGDMCTSPIREADGPLEHGELVMMVAPSGLKAIYAFDARKGSLVADRVFQTEVSRGSDRIA